jgi:hypothetical protein
MPGTVTVACKLPHGLKLRLFNMVDSQEPILGGGYRTVKVAREMPKSVTLKGWSHAQNMAPDAQIIGGYALTPNVDKDFWDAWLAQNQELDAVRNNLIFAHDKSVNAEAESKEKRDVRSGLERLDPKKLPKGVTQSDLMKKN